jgi:hypothetical protein
MSKYKVGDKVTAHYPTYAENGTVTQVIPVSISTTDYYVTFSKDDRDIFEESDLTAQF